MYVTAGLVVAACELHSKVLQRKYRIDFILSMIYYCNVMYLSKMCDLTSTQKYVSLVIIIIIVYQNDKYRILLYCIVFYCNTGIMCISFTFLV
jgi:hypothetical protein